jgi:hypothetical protein
MTGTNIEKSHSEKGYKIRCMRSLVEQIKEDHARLSRMWLEFERGKADPVLMEELERVLSLLKQSLSAFRQMRKQGIEGVTCGEINGIEKDVNKKETHLRLLLYSIFMETEYYYSSHFSLSP